MSSKHRDYTRYSNTNPVKAEETPVAVEETTVDIPEEVAPVEETETVENETGMAVYGIVEGCKALNVREAPSTNAAIISVIAAGNVVQIIEDESTDEFYGVHVENDGVDFDGFCMKKYIRLV